jgi:hypothetical protein
MAKQRLDGHAGEREEARRYGACRQERRATTGSDSEQPEHGEWDGVVASKRRLRTKKEKREKRVTGA